VGAEASSPAFLALLQDSFGRTPSVSALADLALPTHALAHEVNDGHGSLDLDVSGICGCSIIAIHTSRNTSRVALSAAPTHGPGSRHPWVDISAPVPVLITILCLCFCKTIHTTGHAVIPVGNGSQGYDCRSRYIARKRIRCGRRSWSRCWSRYRCVRRGLAAASARSPEDVVIGVPGGVGRKVVRPASPIAGDTAFTLGHACAVRQLGADPLVAEIVLIGKAWKGRSSPSVGFVAQIASLGDVPIQQRSAGPASCRTRGIV